MSRSFGVIDNKRDEFDKKTLHPNVIFSCSCWGMSSIYSPQSRLTMWYVLDKWPHHYIKNLMWLECFALSSWKPHVVIQSELHSYFGIGNCEVYNKPAFCHASKLTPPTSAAYMRWWTQSTLVQIMACRLVGARPFFEPMLEYCFLDP